MDASLEVKILIVLAAVALLAAFVLSWRATVRFGRLVAWVEATYPERWNELHWTLRRIAKGSAVAGLSRRGLGDDPEFARRYGDFRRLQRWMIALVVIGSAPIGLVIFGTRFWGWQW